MSRARGLAARRVSADHPDDRLLRCPATWSGDPPPPRRSQSTWAYPRGTQNARDGRLPRRPDRQLHGLRASGGVAGSIAAAPEEPVDRIRRLVRHRVEALAAHGGIVLAVLADQSPGAAVRRERLLATMAGPAAALASLGALRKGGVIRPVSVETWTLLSIAAIPRSPRRCHCPGRSTWGSRPIESGCSTRGACSCWGSCRADRRPGSPPGRCRRRTPWPDDAGALGVGT